MKRDDLLYKTLPLIDKGNVVISWATGVGKTRMAIEMINHLYKTNNNLKVLFVVTETAHKDNWKKELSKWSCKITNYNMDCYNSLKKHQHLKYDVIVFDEAHHLGSDIRIEIISNIKATKVIALSATLPDSILYTLQEQYGRFNKSTCSLEEAIKNGFLPEPKVILIPLKLNSLNKTEEIIEERGSKEKRVVVNCDYEQMWNYKRDKIKYPNLELHIRCTQLQKYNYITEQFEYWKKRYMLTRQEFMKNKWLQAGSQRKRFLGECKTSIVKEFLKQKQIYNKRYICFCSSIEQSLYLNKKHSINSENKQSQEIIKQFNDKKIKNLFAVGMLQEGANLTNIQIGIIIQMDNAEIAFIQKFGRTLRSDSPIQYIFYYENTRDEEFIQAVYKNIDPQYIQICQIQ